ncbi:MAG: DMT family transporter [Alphaproteobacteria bacterium]
MHESNTTKNSSLPMIMAVTGAVMLGISPIFVRITDIGPNATGFFRLLLALPLVWAWMLVENKLHPKTVHKPNGKEHWLMILAGFFFSLDLAAWHLSIDMTTVINASLFNNFTPFFVPFFLWMIYKERPSWVYILCVVAAITGAMIMSGGVVTVRPEQLVGDALALFSAMIFSGYILVIKSLRFKFNASTLMWWTTISNAVFMLIFCLYTGEDFWPDTTNDWIGVLGLAACIHIGGQGLLAYSMGKVSAGFIVVLLLLSPVVASVLGWMIFDESIQWIQVLGGAIILGSIVVARMDERKSDPSYD